MRLREPKGSPEVTPEMEIIREEIRKLDMMPPVFAVYQYSDIQKKKYNELAKKYNLLVPADKQGFGIALFKI